MKTVYIAGPYRWRGSRWVPAIIGEIINIYKAWKIARDCWVAGFAAVCPHTNGMLMDRFGGTPELFLKGDLNILRQCDCILMMPEWEKSKGAIAERDFALTFCIPIYYSIDSLKREIQWQ